MLSLMTKRIQAVLWIITVLIMMASVTKNAKAGTLLNEQFSTDIFSSGDWSRSDASVSVDVASGWLRIGSNGPHDDYAEKSGSFPLPLIIEWRERTYTGDPGIGPYFSLPKLEFHWGSADNENYRIMYTDIDNTGLGGWLLGGWTNILTLGPTNWNQWRTVKAIIRSDGGELFAKQDGDQDFTPIATTTWAIPNVIERFRLSQNSDNVSDFDYVLVINLSQEPNCTQFTTVGSPVQLTFNSADDGEPSWSPDGTMIAFASYRTGNQEIYIIDLAAGTDAPVTSNGNNNWHPDWSPDGQLISYTGGPNSDQIWVSAPDGSGETAITTSGPHRHPDWSPDGSEFAYTAIIGVEGPVRRINSDGSGTPSTVVSSGWYADWSPDGSRIAFARYAGGGQIYLVDPDGSNLKNISTSSDYHAYPAWSPDGSTIACSITKSGNSEIYIIDTLGNELLQVTNSPSSDVYPTWSPLGDAIAFHSNRSGNADIWKVGIACEGANILVYITWDPSCSYPCCCYPMTFFDEGLAQVLGLDGHSVTLTDRVTTPVITSGLLANYDQFWFLSTAENHDVVLSPPEIDAILEFRNHGGGLFIAADNAPHYTWTANQIALPLGVQFYGSVDHAPEFTCLSPTFDNHPLFTGVSELVLGRNESDISVTSPAYVVATYDGHNVVAALYDGKGRCAFDGSFVRAFDGWITQCDNAQYFRNVAEWLQEGENPYADEIEQTLICAGVNPEFSCATALAALLPWIGTPADIISLRNGFCSAAMHFEDDEMVLGWIHYMISLVDALIFAVEVYTLDIGFPLDVASTLLTCTIAKIDLVLEACASGMDFECIAEILNIASGIPLTLLIIDSPVDVDVLNQQGQPIGMEVAEGQLVGTGEVPFVFGRGANHRKYLLIGDAQANVTIRITGDPTAVYPDSVFSAYILKSGDGATASVQFTGIPIGAGIHFDYSVPSSGPLCNYMAGDLNQDGQIESTYAWYSVSGMISGPSGGVVGVPVDLYDAEGQLAASVSSDDTGHCHIDSVSAIEYSISISTPLGYRAVNETQEINSQSIEHQVDFELLQLEVTPTQRSMGYWKHQVNVHLSGKGNAQETPADMSNYMSLISQHFNNNLANRITIFEVPQPATQTDSLEALKGLLTMKGNSPMGDRAKQQLIALMLNVVSLKLHQTTPISEDSATVSQAITYCDHLITDSDPNNDEVAKDIADNINNGILVASGVIPLTTPDISYKGTEEQTAQTPNLPAEFSLDQNYPNPFNPDCQIRYSLPGDGEVNLSIYNLLGQKVRTLVEQDQTAGHQTVRWDGTDNNGNKLASGIYFYRIQAGDFTDAKKMILMK